MAINVGLQDGMDTLAMNTACKKGEMASFWRSISTNFVWECKNQTKEKKKKEKNTTKPNGNKKKIEKITHSNTNNNKP